MLPPFHTVPVKLLRHMRDKERWLASQKVSGYLGTSVRNKKGRRSQSLRRQAQLPLFHILEWAQPMARHELLLLALGSSD